MQQLKTEQFIEVKAGQNSAQMSLPIVKQLKKKKEKTYQRQNKKAKKIEVTKEIVEYIQKLQYLNQKSQQTLENERTIFCSLITNIVQHFNLPKVDKSQILQYLEKVQPLTEQQLQNTLDGQFFTDLQIQQNECVQVQMQHHHHPHNPISKQIPALPNLQNLNNEIPIITQPKVQKTKKAKRIVKIAAEDQSKQVLASQSTHTTGSNIIKFNLPMNSRVQLTQPQTHTIIPQKQHQQQQNQQQQQYNQSLLFQQHNQQQQQQQQQQFQTLFSQLSQQSQPTQAQSLLQAQQQTGPINNVQNIQQLLLQNAKNNFIQQQLSMNGLQQSQQVKVQAQEQGIDKLLLQPLPQSQSQSQPQCQSQSQSQPQPQQQNTNIKISQSQPQFVQQQQQQQQPMPAVINQSISSIIDQGIQDDKKTPLGKEPNLEQPGTEQATDLLLPLPVQANDETAIVAQKIKRKYTKRAENAGLSKEEKALKKGKMSKKQAKLQEKMQLQDGINISNQAKVIGNFPPNIDDHSANANIVGDQFSKTEQVNPEQIDAEKISIEQQALTQKKVKKEKKIILEGELQKPKAPRKPRQTKPKSAKNANDQIIGEQIKQEEVVTQTLNKLEDAIHLQETHLNLNKDSNSNTQNSNIQSATIRP